MLDYPIYAYSGADSGRNRANGDPIAKIVTAL